jgi:hypothetical protein
MAVKPFLLVKAVARQELSKISLRLFRPSIFLVLLGVESESNLMGFGNGVALIVGYRKSMT